MKKINIICMLFTIFSIFEIDCAFAVKKSGKNAKSTIVNEYRSKNAKYNSKQNIKNKNQSSFQFVPNLNFKDNNLLLSFILCTLIADQLTFVDAPTINTTPDQSNGANSANFDVSTRKEPMFMITEPIPSNLKLQLYDDLERVYRNHEYCDYFLDEERKTYKKEYKELEKRIRKPNHINPNFCSKINEKFKKKQTLDKIFVDINDARNFSVISESFYKIANSGYLAVAGISRCVALSIFNPETKTSGIAHISGENIQYIDHNLDAKDNKDYLSGFQKFIGLIAGNTDLSLLEVTLLGGHQSDIEYCFEFMKQFGFDNLNIIYNKHWGDSKHNEVSDGSLAIECNTGKIYAIRNHYEVATKMKRPNRIKPVELSLETN